MNTRVLIIVGVLFLNKMTLKEQIILELENQDCKTNSDIARRILDMVKVHLENEGSLDD